uniref:Uncharacterized protein n=1 Tax=Cannabis sativa TaxID=3483 RepID=A0A803PBP6_CANSA
MLEEVKAQMEAIEQFYVKRRGNEYDKMKKFANNISSRHNVEFADYDKWDEPFPNIMNKAEMTERLCHRVGTDVAPFLSDLLDQSATTNYKLEVDRFTMMTSGDPVYVVDAMRNQANAQNAEEVEKKAIKEAEETTADLSSTKQTLAQAYEESKKKTSELEDQIQKMGQEKQDQETRTSKVRKQHFVYSLYTIWKLNKSMMDFQDDKDREKLMPQVLKLAKQEEAKKAVRAVEVVNPGTFPLEGENLEDLALLAVDAPSVTNYAIPKVSIDVQPDDA